MIRRILKYLTIGLRWVFWLLTTTAHYVYYILMFIHDELVELENYLES